MQRLTAQVIASKKVLLRMDLDVPIKDGKVLEPFRILAGLDTLDFCLQYADSVIIMGHIGRPEGKEDPVLTMKPIVDWFEAHFAHINLPEGKLHILENLRFEPGEDAADPKFAQELAGFGDFYVNEAFASHHPAASTTVLPTLLPHAAGFQFEREVSHLDKLRYNPGRPLVAVIGGVKVEDKLPAVQALAHIADTVLVGGKIAQLIKDKELNGEIEMLPSNVHLAKLTEDGQDITSDTVQSWQEYISQAKTVLWSGPLGMFEEVKNEQTKNIAYLVANAPAFSVIGGGDTIAACDKWGVLHQFDFVSTGGGAMLEFLVKGTLPTIEALS